MGACASTKESSNGSSVGTLYYFKGAYARGESIRILLAYKDVQYNKEDLTMEEFGAKKAAGVWPGG